MRSSSRSSKGEEKLNDSPAQHINFDFLIPSRWEWNQVITDSISLKLIHMVGLMQSEEFGEMVKLELLEEPHPHPLTFMVGRVNSRQDMLCCGCNKPLYPPAFICATCNFYVHQSCIHLPPQIRTRFHPRHRLTRADINCDRCHCCWQQPRNCIYACRCGFVIDVKCALSDTKQSGLQWMAGQAYQHFSHPHPLILQEQITGSKIVVCHVCEMLLVSGPAYFCSFCNVRFHKASAELPREKLHPERHPHSLFLFPQCTAESFCDTCKN